MPRFSLAAAVLAAAVLVLASGAERVAAGGPVVNSTDDGNDGNCNAAHCSLREALLAAEAGDTISFNIPGDGPHVIQPEDDLPPVIADTVTVDGYTQAGASPNTAGPWEPGNAVLQIVIDGSLNNALDAAGISVFGQGATIRGLVIQNFTGDGVFVSTAASAAIRGNYIGTDVTGMEDAGNDESGVYIYSDQPGNVVGGGNPADRNVLSGNEDDGIEMIGGVSLAINGNFIGTDALGTGAIPNSNSGIDMRDGPESGIGGPAEGAGNLISGNGEHGVLLRGLGSNKMQVKNNLIGTAADGETPLPNGMHGIFLDQGAHDNTLGGVQPPNWNTIAFNGGAGVALSSSAGANNYIDPNVIHSNDGLGIDLNVDGVTPNDEDDPDTGPNDVQNFPEIVTAEVMDDGSLRVEGTLNSVAGKFYPLFIFVSSECDDTGYGEGERFLAEVFASALNGTLYVFAVTIDETVYAGDVITATASNPESTSEFSECFEVEGAPAAIWGDVDCTDGAGALDALKILLYTTGADVPAPEGCPQIGEEVEVDGETRLWGDVDCNGVVNELDALQVLKFDSGLEVEQPDGCPQVGEDVDLVVG